jgi:hypothetical protein
MAKDIGTSNLIDVWASAGPVSEPDLSKKNEGWQLGEQPPHEFMNWLQNTFGEKLNHVLKNGVATWNNETQYTAGNAVQHNGFIWVSQTTNTNSTPTDPNAAWRRLIDKTVFDTALDGVVLLTGNQTIAGVKTFSSNPISTATQSTAANSLTRRDFVIGLDGANVKLTGNQTIAGTKTFSSTIGGSISGNAATATNATTAANLTRSVIAGTGLSGGGQLTANRTINITEASVAEAVAGTLNNSVITPRRVRSALNASGTAPIYAARAWVRFNGITTSIAGSGNISSVVKNGTGLYSINLVNAMPDVDYAISGAVSADSPASSGNAPCFAAAPNTASQFSVATFQSQAVGIQTDLTFCQYAVFR